MKTIKTLLKKIKKALIKFDKFMQPYGKIAASLKR